MSGSEIRAMARRWVDGLSGSEVGAVMDAMVLGDFDWRDWFEDRPPAGFTRAAFEAAQLREETAR